ncbi:MAG: TonB-dependent receptor plug domain-containing protein [Leptospiraceae bacterium]|nr:TonB-dependent receptor plug domain-containing protein [Leptospiraceae bacterium]
MPCTNSLHKRLAIAIIITISHIFPGLASAQTEIQNSSLDSESIQLCRFETSPDVAPQLVSSMIRSLVQKAERASIVLSISESCSMQNPTAGNRQLAGYIARDARTRNLAFYMLLLNGSPAKAVDAISLHEEAITDFDTDFDFSVLKEEDISRIENFNDRLIIRLRTNRNFKLHSDRVDNVLRNSVLAKALPQEDALIPVQNISSERSSDVFKVISEYAVTVASNVVTEKDKQPVSITIISREKINLSGARNLTQLLNTYVPGYFTIEDQDDIIAGFRGLAPDNNVKVLLLLNGHNLNTEWFWGPPDALLQSFDLGFIERLEIIRGPGSVTLGQGALLGVINIVTRKNKVQNNFTVIAAAGSEQLARTSIFGSKGGLLLRDLSAFGYFSLVSLNGQPVRREAYALDKLYEGSELPANSKLADNSLRLNRARNSTLLADLQYTENHKLRIMNTLQRRDSYNFYRDRSIFENSVFTIGSENLIPLKQNINLKLKTDFANDDLEVLSASNIVNGGTREMRFGINGLVSIQDLPKKNRIAVGAEYRRYIMGLANSSGNNFVANKSSTRFNASNQLVDRNGQYTYIYPFTINVFSFFAEDFYSLTPWLDVFAALRYDRHTGWGDNLSPRAGAILNFGVWGRYRINYHEGFRGAPGQSYAGGWRNDGFLRVENFDKIAAARIPDGSGFYQNIPATRPEKMRSIETAASWEVTKDLNVSVTGFYSQIENVIDVGVIFVDAGVATVPPLGSDIPGDWNGYWFYKNNEGVIRQGGLEAEISYSYGIVKLEASHSLVKLISAPDAQLGSMYVTSGKKFRAYPENVTRAQLWVAPREDLTLHLNWLHYYQWNSPNNNVIASANLVNFGSQYSPTANSALRFVVRNLLNDATPYPMNANAGGKDQSDGSPALDARSYWFEFEYSLSDS